MTELMNARASVTPRLLETDAAGSSVPPTAVDVHRSRRRWLDVTHADDSDGSCRAAWRTSASATA